MDLNHKRNRGDPLPSLLFHSLLPYLLRSTTFDTRSSWVRVVGELMVGGGWGAAVWMVVGISEDSNNAKAASRLNRARYNKA